MVETVNKKRRLRSGLVGCGRIGANTRDSLRETLGPAWIPLSHAEAMNNVEELDLIACCDVSAEASENCRREYGFQRSFTRYEELLDHSRLDVLSVATRADVRRDIVSEAMRAGVSGFHLEKPVGQSLSSVKELCGEMNTHGAILSYGALRRYMPIFQEARRSIEAGLIGRLVSINVKFGYGGLLWLHPHTIDLIDFFANGRTPVDIQARFHAESFDVPGGISGLLDFDPVLRSATISYADGLHATILPEKGLSIELAGEDGGIAIVGDGAWRVDYAYGQGFKMPSPGTWPVSPNNADTSGRVHAYRDLVLAMRGETRAMVSPDDIVRQQSVLTLMVQSHLEGGRWLGLDNVDPDLRVTGSTMGKPA